MDQTKKPDLREKKSKAELKIQRLNSRIEQLKIQYTLFFSGEIRLPPEKERETVENSIRKILESEYKSPRMNLLVQNLASSFSLYNNMWLKKMNELETGVSMDIQAYIEKPAKPTQLLEQIEKHLQWKTT